VFRVYDCVTQQHDFRLVFLAGLICLFASYTACNVIARTRTRSQGYPAAWLCVAAVVLGSGIWATHFIAMLAYRPSMPLGFDLDLTAVSALDAVVMSGIGLLIGRTRTQTATTALAGGAVIGVGVGVMHFTGMAAFLVPAVKHWDATYVHASLAIGIAGAAASLWTMRRGDGPIARVAAASLLTLAICGLHFTAMAALSLEPDPRIAFPEQMVAPEWMAVAITAITLLIVSLALAGSIIDQHLAERNAQESARLRAHVSELEATKQTLEARTRELAAALEAAAVGSETKSRFLAAMSHELRTPLNAIVGFSEAMSKEMFGPMNNQRYLEYTNDIQGSAKHLLALINDILDFSKLDAGHLELREEAVDLPAIVADALHMTEIQAQNAGVSVKTSVPENLPCLWADPRRVRQILLNLISNAVKFTPEGGEIKISASVPQGAGAGLVITVADTGIGMDQDEIPLALERFGQVDSGLSRNFEGAGLGLPLSKRLVELHGGTLTIESARGAGTTVTVAFPAKRLSERLNVA
jgi:signal transduction histidine kinase